MIYENEKYLPIEYLHKLTLWEIGYQNLKITILEFLFCAKPVM